MEPTKSVADLPDVIREDGLSVRYLLPASPKSSPEPPAGRDSPTFGYIKGW